MNAGKTPSSIKYPMAVISQIWEKMDSRRRPAEKMLTLYTMLLFTGMEASLSELSRELNCSKQAVWRNFALLL